MRRAILFFVLAVSFSLPWGSGSHLYSQPVRDRVLGKLKIAVEEDYAVIEVGFNFPVRYVRHFPYESGKELRIKMAPISVGAVDQDALFERESIRPSPGELPTLLEVAYEGDMPGGPFLTLLFQQELEYLVVQGPDFRSLIIVVGLPAETTPSSTSHQGAE